FDLQISIPNGTGVPTVKKRSVDAPLSVIIRLPPNTDITLSVLDGAGNPRPEPGMTQTVNSGAAIPGVATTTPTLPYEHCNSEAILPANPPSDNGFLTFNYGKPPYTSLIDAENETVANAYYDAIDPDGKKKKFDDWKKENGLFGVAPDAEA